MNNLETINYIILNDDATEPTRTYPTDAGLDIYAAENQIIMRDETKMIHTGIAVDIPAGWQGEIRPRSGKTGDTALRVQLGTVDAGYIGEIKVICDVHHKASAYAVQKGEKIAQLVLTPVATPKPNRVDTFAKETDRGGKGFGHSGE